MRRGGGGRGFLGSYLGLQENLWVSYFRVLLNLYDQIFKPYPHLPHPLCACFTRLEKAFEKTTVSMREKKSSSL